MEYNKELEKLDMITERIGCTYKEAREALQNNNGDVLEAIIELEEEYDYDDFDFDFDFDFKGSESNTKREKIRIVESLKELLDKANATRVTIYDKESRVILDIPVTAGAIGGVLFLPATLVALLGALITGCSLKIIREDGDEININELSKDQFEKVKESLDKLSKKVKEESEAFDESVKTGNNCKCNDDKDDSCCDSDKTEEEADSAKDENSDIKSEEHGKYE